MRTKKSFRFVLLPIGCELLFVSVIFFVYSAIEYESGAVSVEKVLVFIDSVIPGKKTGIKEERSNSEMPSVTYDGQDYSAVLSLPGLSVTLPVRSTWDKAAVKNIPCRFAGNPYDGSLIIGGVDEKGQFDFVSRIDVGDVITVTDMKGYVFTYTVSAVKHSKDSKSNTLMDGNFDLTLFAKDKKTGDWLLVRCKMK